MSTDYIWGNSHPYNAYSDYFKKKYGQGYRKIAVNAGFTCPNRDGSIGTEGCSYCNNKAFSPSYCDSESSISEQIVSGMAFNRHKFKNDTFNIAYFQSYTNTYGNLDKLIQLYSEAIATPGISGISVSTRPDCISDELIDFLTNLAHEKYVCVELGIESCFDETLERINRGHTFAQTVDIVEKLSDKGIVVCGHIIFGLPNETSDMLMLEARVLSNMPIDILKIHQLQLFKNTTLEEQYLRNPQYFKFFSLDEYIEILIAFLEKLSPNISIERLISEVPAKYLVVKPWENTPSEIVLNQIVECMRAKNTFQGRLF